MATWAQFASAAPELAEKGARLYQHAGAHDALLATVRGDLPPRISPVNAMVVDGRLLTFVIVGSAKLRELESDGRYALHAHQDPAAPHEFQVRGRATPVSDAALRASAASVWPFTPDDGYRLFELEVEQAILGERPTADDWPPRYSSWREPT
jgi:hypothetical protein